MNAAAFLLLALVSSAEPRAAGGTIDVELAKAFTLKKGETARLPGGRATLRIERFIDSPCPKGAYCAWSGQAVIHELTVDGKVVRSKDAPYNVDVKDSDYRTYAVFIVDEPELACARLDPLQGGECLRALARLRRAPKLCRAIKDARTRGFCLEDLAEELKDDSLCRDVATSSQYCLYVRAIAAGDLASCGGIVLFRWRARCFKRLSVEGGGGPGACSKLAPEAAKDCRELAAGPDE